MLRLSLVALIAASGPVFAQPVDEDLQALWQQCVAQATGHLTTTPGTVDRWTSLDRRVNLSWAVSLPAECPSSVKIEISPRQEAWSHALPRIGGMPSNEIHHARWLTLVVSAGNYRKVLDSKYVQVKGDPGAVAVSDGPKFAHDDIADFNALWMQPYEVNRRFQRVCNNLRDRNETATGEAFEFALAMVRMYDITHDVRYAKALGKFADYIMTKRDDRHPDERTDFFRDLKRGPGWGGAGANTANYYTLDERASSLAGYAVAAYARIVLEDPTLRMQFGDQAIDHLNAISSTAHLFLRQMRYELHDSHREAVLLHLKRRDDEIPTNKECEEYANNNPEGITTHVGNCKNISEYAGKPLPYNVIGTFMMMLVETWRASNTEAYQQSPRKTARVQGLRVITPILVSRFQRFFWRHLEEEGNSYYWNYADEGPDTNLEDTGHGALDMTYLGVVRDNLVALNAVAADRNEPLPALGSLELSRFANTFLFRIATGDNFRSNVAGGDEASEHNEACEGWAMMTAGKPGVFTICRKMFQRMVSEQKPHLGTHAALLNAKRLLPQSGQPDAVGSIDEVLLAEENPVQEVVLPSCSGDPLPCASGRPEFAGRDCVHTVSPSDR